MIPVTDIVTPRFQLAVLAAILFQSLQSIAMPTIISAAEQEMPPRHSLIHRSAVESPALPATTQGTILQPPSAESPRITSPIRPPKPPASLPTMPSTHHRTLTKRPAIASTTAPATSSQTLRAALTSGTAAGQVTQTTADPTKGTTPTTTAPITKSMAAPLPGVTSTGSAAVAPTARSPFAGAASVRSAASAGSGSAPSFSGSRSALNLLQNSAIASLLQPSTPVVTTPPSLPPPSTPPPPSPSQGSVTLTWTANREPDIAGYKVYVGTASGTYSFPGSAFVIGKVTSYTVSNLPMGQTYFFAISAYDSAGNESLLSAEVSKSLF
ncbi:MAG: fibronectin type III domain-containing protein [Nitrospirae bacterium]|nr:MAG: fibronectin type III domain-containing protein [Nitrospirota bacterium]